ncbi:hypothetical protein [Natronorubrum aibiense]|nr:hypothetical protein [Natronorubrum aibiense]
MSVSTETANRDVLEHTTFRHGETTQLAVTWSIDEPSSTARF